MSSVRLVVKNKYVRVLNMIVELCVTPCFLGFTTLRVLHEYGRVYITCFLAFFYTYNIYVFLVKCISHTCIMYEEMFVSRFFPHWVFLRNYLDWQLKEKPCSTNPRSVWTDPSSCVVMYFSYKINMQA